MSALADKQVADREGPIAKPSLIPYVKEGSPDTLLSASRANQIIAAYNRLANLSVGPGLILTWSDSGPVISLDENT